MPLQDPTRRHLLAAAAFAAAAAAWAMAGTVLPGGRWLAVHLLTVGVATNLLAGLMPFFARTVLHAPFDDGRARVRFAVLNVGAILLLVGMPSGSVPVLAAGATGLAVAVFLLWRALRTARRSALGSRFAFVVRTYERACGAFLHGALLGAALGLALVPGGWYAGVRLAHLHVNLLGWVGLPLLATLVTLGPTVLRTRMADRAGPRAAAALPRAATGLTVAVVALLLTGAPAPFDRALALLAGAGLAVYTYGVAAVCLPVLAVYRSRVPSLAGTLLTSSCAWFLLASALDAVLVASGRWALLDVLAPGLLVGVLAQAILGALLHLLPMLMTRSADARSTLRTRLADIPPAAAVPLNAGVAGLTLLAFVDRLGAALPAGLTALAWAVVAAAILLLGSAMAWACLQAAPARTSH